VRETSRSMLEPHMNQQSLPTLDVVVALINRDLAAAGYDALSEEQIECLRDPVREDEARAMVDDLHARVAPLAKDTCDTAEVFLYERPYDAPRFSEVMARFPNSHHHTTGGDRTAWRLPYNGGELIFIEPDTDHAPPARTRGMVCVSVFPDTLIGEVEREENVSMAALQAWIDAFLDKTAEG
jgi:hypothetical protein